MLAIQPRVPGASFAILLLVLQHFEMVDASPIFNVRSDNATSGSGLSQPEKITLYVVAAVGGLFAIMGITICILRTRHQKQCQNSSQRMTKSILKTLPIVQYHNGNGPYPSPRTSAFDDSDAEGFANEKIEVQKNRACPICTEDFIENQMLHVLPCNHQYHMACIQNWLPRGSSCPVCRIDLRPPTKARTAKNADVPDLEQARPRESNGHAKKLHNRLLRHLYSVGLGQHYNSS